jgi:dienelactone hydrolase
MRENLPSGTPVEIARPPGGGGGTGLVVLADIMGLRPLFDELVARLADENGWVVAAPEPFPGREAMSLEERFGAMPGRRDADVLGDAVAAADATGAERVVLLGFCMGGMYALKAAATGRFAAVASFYGMIKVPEGWRGPDLAEPLEQLRRPGRAPVIALLGGQDPYTPPADVAALRQLNGVEAVVYPQADHGFVHDPNRPSHRAADAADAWSRARRHLSQGGNHQRT